MEQKKPRLNLTESNSTLFLFVSIIFVGCLLISNIMAAKLISIGPLAFTSGVLIFPVTYIINDLIAEVYGYERAKKIIWAGFAMNLLMVLVFKLAAILPYPAYYQNQEAFITVTGSSFRVLCASLSAYLVGSFMNAFIMSKMKAKSGSEKGLMGRAVLSTLAGEFFDSLIFCSVAFVGTMPTKDLAIMIVSYSILKTLYEIIIFPLTQFIIKKFKKIENLDVIDQGQVNYNPFKLS